jgi:hypothetical protein
MKLRSLSTILVNVECLLDMLFISMPFHFLYSKAISRDFFQALLLLSKISNKKQPCWGSDRKRKAAWCYWLPSIFCGMNSLNFSHLMWCHHLFRTLESCNTKLAINYATICYGNKKCCTLCWLIQNKSISSSLWGWYDEM